jgi:hypothetical protein
MSAAKRNLNIERGAEKSFTLQIKDATGAAVNLTGSSFKAEIREAHRKPLVASFTCTTAAPATNGTILCVLADDQTSNLDVSQRYKWDLFWRDSGGTNRRLLYGDVVVQPNITVPNI